MLIFFKFFFSTGGLSSISPSTRDTADPIAELLSQLSGVRRSTASTSAQSSTPSQLQQLQIQLQLERQQVRVWIILLYFITLV